MKNSFLFILFLIFYASNVFSENLLIEAKNISLDKNTEISIFENNVTIKTEDNNTIKSDYVEYNKKKGFLRLKKTLLPEIVKIISSKLITQNIMKKIKFLKVKDLQ